MDALRVWREVEAAEAGGERLLAFYHSHIDCDAYFSQEDRDMAAPPPAGVPTNPDVWHVIVACWPDGVREARAYLWDSRDFVAHTVQDFKRTATLPLAR
jgi:proteasome lid subunit RPN8/RPN11